VRAAVRKFQSVITVWRNNVINTVDGERESALLLVGAEELAV
jgi:limonene-1,2-epoxide hydrolase